jgi:7-carboxy-7-deazaguanine synthase
MRGSVIVPAKIKTLPVIEIFGPTVQGEGSLVGMPVHFIRLGGCDYRCSWCDTPFAVLPSEVRANKTDMTAKEIVDKVVSLEGRPGWVVISGGNPALHNLDELITYLHSDGYQIALETQGSVNKGWFARIDLLTISPKPPSSGMKTNLQVLDDIIHSSMASQIDIKTVVFDDDDMAYAKMIHQRYPTERMYLSTGTLVGISDRDDILDRMRITIEKGLRDPELAGVGYGMQLHVLLWGHVKGV